eukprot:scaffold61164_cov57-Phaeocystis_antarctica.AAC.2
MPKETRKFGRAASGGARSDQAHKTMVSPIRKAWNGKARRVCEGARHGVQHDVCDAGRPKLWVVLAPWGVMCEECCGRAASWRKRGLAGRRHEKIEVAAALGVRLRRGGPPGRHTRHASSRLPRLGRKHAPLAARPISMEPPLACEVK